MCYMPTQPRHRLPSSCADADRAVRVESECRNRKLIQIFPSESRSASTSFAARSSPRVRARRPTPRPPASSAWSLPSACSTSVTASLSSAARPRRSRMRPYVHNSLFRHQVQLLTGHVERVCRCPRQARRRGQGQQGRCPQAESQLHAQVNVGCLVMDGSRVALGKRSRRACLPTLMRRVHGIETFHESRE